MRHGWAVDELAEHFLEITSDPSDGEALSETLRSFFHDARNKLNTLRMGIYLARRSSGPEQFSVWNELDASYRGLELLIDRAQTICRPLKVAMVSGDIGAWLEERRGAWSHQLAEAGRELRWVSPVVPAVGEFDPQRLIQGLDALVTWRAGEKAEGPVQFTWSADAHDLRIEWCEEATPAGASSESHPPSGSMTLPLLAHIVAAHGGRLSIARDRGLSLRLAWPRSIEADTSPGSVRVVG